MPLIHCTLNKIRGKEEEGRRKEKERKKKSTTPKNGLKESKKQTSSPRIAAKEQSAGCDLPFCNSNYCTHCSNAQSCTNTRLRRHCSLHHVYFLWALDLFRIRGLRGGGEKWKCWLQASVREEIEVRSDDTTKKIHETLCSRMVCSSVRGVHVYRICANDDVPVLKFLRKQAI